MSFRNKVYVFGGYYGKGRIKENERFNPITNRWELLQLRLKMPLEGAELQQLNENEIMIFGGKTQYGGSNFAFVYNLDSGTNFAGPSLPVAHILPKGAIHENKVFCYSGTNNTDLQIFNIEGDTWKKSFAPILMDSSLMGKISFAKSF